MCSIETTEQLEQTQYEAALAVSEACKGTNRLRLLEELGNSLWSKEVSKTVPCFCSFQVQNS